MSHTKTKIIKFERPLDPQPPYRSKPFWCYVNTLIFCVGLNEVWQQKIPEAFMKKEFDELDGRCSVSVRRERRWGWLLCVEVSHAKAEKSWNYLLKEIYKL